MIDLKNDGDVAIVTIRHGKANALDIELCEGLTKCFDELRRSDARAVVLTGQGRMFSAGVDLIRVGSGGADYVRAFLPSLHRLYDAVFFHPKPVVAAINGHAIAGGCVLACCADRRIMADASGRIGVTELLVGVPFPALAFEIVRFAVPAPLSDRVHVRRRYLRHRRGFAARLGRCGGAGRNPDDECHGLGPANGAAIARGVRPSQEANPPARQRQRCSQRGGDG